MNQATSGRILTIDEVAEYVGVSRDTVSIWVTRGWLKAFNVSRGKSMPRWRIPEADLRTFLESRTNQESATAPVRRREKPAKRYF